FSDYVIQQDDLSNRFDFTDCALGNILFAGCYLMEEREFNRAVEAFARFYEVQAGLLNVTKGENLFLVARKRDGGALFSETEIVAAENPSRIEDIFLIEEAGYRSAMQNGQNLSAAELDRLIARSSRVPAINAQACAALESADVIIYGPGTQHSSLFPSYLT